MAAHADCTNAWDSPILSWVPPDPPVSCVNLFRFQTDPLPEGDALLRAARWHDVLPFHAEFCRPALDPQSLVWTWSFLQASPLLRADSHRIASPRRWSRSGGSWRSPSRRPRYDSAAAIIPSTDF